MSDNLTGALAGSLRIVESQNDSPLAEATVNSVDELLEYINSAFAEGMPEKLTEQKLDEAIDLFRAQALKWEQDEEIKATKAKTRSSAPRKSPAQVINLDDLP